MSNVVVRQKSRGSVPEFLAGGAMHLEAMSWSDYRHLLADLGNEVVQAAPVPYSKNMGLSGGGNGGLFWANRPIIQSQQPESIGIYIYIYHIGTD